MTLSADQWRSVLKQYVLDVLADEDGTGPYFMGSHADHLKLDAEGRSEVQALIAEIDEAFELKIDAKRQELEIKRQEREARETAERPAKLRAALDAVFDREDEDRAKNGLPPVTRYYS